MLILNRSFKNYKILTSVGVEPTNAACAPSTATSDVLKDVAVLGAHAAFVDSTPTEVEIFIWIMSPLWSKKTSVAATDERNIIILHRKIVSIKFCVTGPRPVNVFP